MQDRTHPIVTRLLEQEAKRQASRTREDEPYYDTFHLNFSAPLQQRRLRVLSALLLALVRLGIPAEGSTHAGERFGIRVGGHWLHVLIAVENGPRGDPFYRGRGARRREGQRLRLDLVGHSPEREPPFLSWADSDVPLERQLVAIIVGLMVHAEEQAGAESLRRHDYEVMERARLAREAVLAAERAEKERVARQEKAGRARLAALVDGADALERAERIRHYVAIVSGRAGVVPGTADAAALERWTVWALSVADEQDPILSGRFLLDLAAHGGPEPCAAAPGPPTDGKGT